MSAHPDHPNLHLPSPLSSPSWEAWAVAWLRRLEASPAIASHFAFEARADEPPPKTKGSMDGLAPDTAAADLLDPEEVEEALARGEDPFRVSPEAGAHGDTGRPRPASLQGLLRLCRVFGTPEAMAAQVYARGALTVFATGDPGLNLALVSLLQDPHILAPAATVLRPCVMLCEQAAAAEYRKSVPDLWSGLHRDLRDALQTTRPILLITTDITSCPREIIRLQPEVLTLPRLDPALLLAHLRQSHSRTGRIAEDLVVQNLPDDVALARLALEEFAGSLRRETPAEVAADLARRCASAPAAPALSDFPVEPEVRETIDQMLADLRDWQRGDLPWSDVTRGVLLAGPPGTGKTEVARLMAREAGTALRAGSLASWQGAGDRYAGFLKAMQQFFASAAAAAPCIAFIDELDAVGDRDRPHDHNSSYTDSVVTALLEQLDGFAAREGVILLAATNHVDRIDAALRRPGRFDKILHLHNPSPVLMPQVLRWHLRGDLAADDLSTIAVHANGMSGADVAAMVRDARARARRARQPFGIEHLQAAIATLRPPTSTALRRRIALHEAGHAVAGVATGCTRPSLIAIRGDGGVTETRLSHDGTDRSMITAHLAVLLAGRAAERLIFGTASGGAGGTPDSDLARATKLAAAMEASFGLGASLTWLGPVEKIGTRLQEDMHLRGLVEDHLQNAEARALTILRANRTVLEEISSSLFESGVLAGPDLEAKLARVIPEPTGCAGLTTSQPDHQQYQTG